MLDHTIYKEDVVENYKFVTPECSVSLSLTGFVSDTLTT